jgi:hypothetical protein
MGPPGTTDSPTLSGRGDTPGVGQSSVWARWPDGSRSMAIVGRVTAWGTVAHLMNRVEGQPWEENIQFTLGTRRVEHGFLEAGHYNRLGFTVFALDDGLHQPAFTSILVMPGPHDVSDEPTWYWAEEDSQPSAATGFRPDDSE